jgi:hypothetical protein
MYTALSVTVNPVFMEMLGCFLVLFKKEPGKALTEE